MCTTGKVRTVEISKGGTPFFSLSHFHRAFPFIDSLIEQYRKIGKGDKPALAYKLAEILDTVNYLHPFREGNGRAQRVFIEYVAQAAGWHIDFSNVSDHEMLEASALAFALEYDKMTAMLRRIVSPVSPEEQQEFRTKMGLNRKK